MRQGRLKAEVQTHAVRLKLKTCAINIDKLVGADQCVNPFFRQLPKTDSTFCIKLLSKNGSFVYKVLKALKIKGLAMVDFASPALNLPSHTMDSS